MSKGSAASRGDAVPDVPPPGWKFRLYVAGLTPKSLAAFMTLKRLCEEHLAGKYRIDVVDLRADPRAAVEEQVLATPTVVRTDPAPARRVIGDLSNVARVLQGLEIVVPRRA